MPQIQASNPSPWAMSSGGDRSGVARIAGDRELSLTMPSQMPSQLPGSSPGLCRNLAGWIEHSSATNSETSIHSRLLTIPV
jgi:hypothetical protein